MKRISMLLTLVVFVTFVFSGFSGRSYASSQDVESLEELSYSYTENRGEKNIQGVYKDESTNETAHLALNESDGVRNVKHYIDGKLVAEARYTTKTGVIVTKNIETGEEIIQNIDELVTELKRPVEMTATDSPSPGYNFVKKKYNSTWKQYGSLYKKTTVSDTTHIDVQFSAGTAVATILSAIDIIWTKGGLTAILKAFAITITGAAIDTAWYGVLDATKYFTEIEVFSQDKLGLRSEQYILEAKVNGVLKQVHNGGDGRTYDQMIDDAIYNVIILG
ncbi:hypothetical protein [Paenibacillus thiaminolyticus]|uniref:Uncharacterized protein n=1 Tax=Paenibacillus thiaminolyticus TaxID=49283 RepID=A0A3A3GAM2_PANTH|nr:hypothetical protein [Paenibacillus thiaminolyticus]RJG20452.1 hypothetical protein DQX05_25310 [Paenibacillus thiaminolyticus]